MIDIITQLAAGFVHCLTPLNMAMLSFLSAVSALSISFRVAFRGADPAP